MKKSFCRYGAWLLASLASLALAQPWTSRAEDTFDVLKIGTETYTNVTVTTKNTNYIFLIHAGGLTNIKLADLPRDVLVKLGYADRSGSKLRTNGAAAWAKATIKKLPVENIKAIEQQVQKKLALSDLAHKAEARVPAIPKNLLIALSATFLAFFVFFSFCCKLICQKAGVEPGVLIWVPVLQQLRLLQAAKMSRWWFLAYFVPILNIVAQVLWCFRIADARNKSPIIGVFLLLPLLNIFAFLLLAFADKVPHPDDAARNRPVQIMTLEAA